MRGQHHLRPYESHYCTVTNDLNPLLDRIDFWRNLEDAIALFGPRRILAMRISAIPHAPTRAALYKCPVTAAGDVAYPHRTRPRISWPPSSF